MIEIHAKKHTHTQTMNQKKTDKTKCKIDTQFCF